MKEIALSLLLLSPVESQWAYSWAVQEPSQYAGIEIGSLKEHSCEAVKTRPEIARVLGFTGPVPMAMDEPLTSAMAGLVPRPVCGLTMQEAVDRTAAWMAHAYNLGVPSIDLIEPWPHFDAMTIWEFTYQLHSRLGLRQLVIDPDFGVNARSSAHVLAQWNYLRAQTRAHGLELGLLLTPHDGRMALLHSWALDSPVDEYRVQNWTPGLDQEALALWQWLQ